MDIIKIKNVRKTYKTGKTAIYDLSLNIEKGEFVFVIGQTGCGKSTLIKMLYREEKPSEGQILVGGLDVGKIRNRRVYKLRRKLGVVFQNYQLLPNSTAYENVAFALEVLGLHKNEIQTEYYQKRQNGDHNRGSELLEFLKLLRQLYPVIAAADTGKQCQGRRQDVASLALEVHGICIKQPQAEV